MSDEKQAKPALNPFRLYDSARKALEYKDGKFVCSLSASKNEGPDRPSMSDEAIWPKTPLGPFKHAVVGDKSLEYKDGKWVDSEGNEYTLSLTPPEEAVWPGPFRFAAAREKGLEFKDGKWVDKDGQEYVVFIEPPEEAAHRA
jgi:hypothetical protein